MACASRSELIYFLAGLAPELGTHVNGCSTCRMACRAEDVLRIAAAVEEVADARPGTVIDERYVVEEILGAGTYGLVVRAAVRGGGAGEAVAIKLLRPRYNRDQETLARFEREAKILAGLRSRRICRSLASGATGAGTPYIVTELLRGETLRALLQRRGPLPIHVAARLLTAVCEALGEAHARGIVHRDLKPDNVFVCGEDGRAEIKLLDFGMARALHDPRLTGSTQHVGSPLYMAPEQLSDPKAVGPAADLWAIGVMLQELVTGATPFDGATAALVCARVLDGMRDAVTGRAAALEPILDRCMQHHPQHRHASVTELVLALAPHTAEPAPLAAPAARPTRMPAAPAEAKVADPRAAGNGNRRPAPEAVVTLNLAQLRRRRRRLHGALVACSAVALALLVWRIGAGGPGVSVRPAPPKIASAPEPPARPQLERAPQEAPRPPAAPSAGAAALPDEAPRERALAPIRVTPGPVTVPGPRRAASGERSAEQAWGTLRIHTTPWAWATVGGQKQDTPAARFKLPPGRHTIRLHFPTLGVTETHVATIAAHRTFTLSVNKEEEE